MKKLFLLVGLLLPISLLQAQDISDGVRYSLEDLDGSARFISMGGAFGALGGDISALKVNPAGSAVFLSNKAAVSADINTFKNSTDYADGHNSYRNNTVDLNHAGAVFVFNNAYESAGVTRLSFGVSYDRTNSFKNRFTAIGGNNETVGDYFVGLAQGVPLDLFEPKSGESVDDLYDYLGYANEGFNNDELQTAYLGYEGYLFDSADNDLENTEYFSNVGGNEFNHVYHSYEKGLNGKVTFNGGLAIADQFFFGLNLNSHFIDYRRTTILNEDIPQPSEINEINFQNYLDTRGSGFSFQVGGIAKFNDIWRVGASYESPTWYRIHDETTQFLRTDSQELGDAVVDPRIINVYPHYRMRSPGQLNGSIAAVIGRHGIISFDYSYKDFSNIKYTTGGFGDLNDDLSDALQEVNTYRLGGEYRIKELSLRAGLRYQDSPYKDKTVGDLKGYSAGLGYDFGRLRLDFAYDLAQRDYNQPLLYTGFSENASIKNDRSHYVLTVTFDI